MIATIVAGTPTAEPIQRDTPGHLALLAITKAGY
jgi:hypothetical protein